VQEKSSADQVTFLETIPDIRLPCAVRLADLASTPEYHLIVRYLHTLLLREIYRVIMGPGKNAAGNR
jgi:hypothetical protein